MKWWAVNPNLPVNASHIYAYIIYIYVSYIYVDIYISFIYIHIIYPLADRHHIDTVTESKNC